MKRIFIAALSLFTLVAAAQLEVKRTDGTPINDGAVFTFTSLTQPENYLGIKLYNTSDEEIRVRAKVESIVNSNGTNLQLCIGGVCLLSITAGNTYPNFPAIIEANGENGNFDHFVNFNPGIDPAQPVEYTIRILMVNEANQEVGNSVTFTYRYVSPLSTDSFSLNSLGVALKSTYVDSSLMLTSTADANVQLFDVNGKLVQRHTISAGESYLDVSALNSGVYIANFTVNGRSASTRIVKK